MRGGEPEAPSCRARPHVDFVGSATWSDPPGILLLGVVTITGASCRRHLLDGAAALLSALDNERGPACAPGPVLPQRGPAAPCRGNRVRVRAPRMTETWIINDAGDLPARCADHRLAIDL